MSPSGGGPADGGLRQFLASCDAIGSDPVKRRRTLLGMSTRRGTAGGNSLRSERGPGVREHVGPFPCHRSLLGPPRPAHRGRFPHTLKTHRGGGTQWLRVRGAPREHKSLLRVRPNCPSIISHIVPSNSVVILILRRCAKAIPSLCGSLKADRHGGRSSIAGPIRLP